MDDIGPKVDYVRAESANPTGHHCHWPGCTEDVPPARWGCRAHWYTLPKNIRLQIWLSFKPGQEKTKTPSAAYVMAARNAQAWIKSHIEAHAPAQGRLFL